MEGEDLAGCGEERGAVRLLLWARTRLYAQGVVALLAPRAEIAAVQSVADARACYTLAAAGAFDAVLLDASLPDAAVSIGTLRRVAPDLPIVALAVPESEDAVLRCVETPQGGARGVAAAGASVKPSRCIGHSLVRCEFREWRRFAHRPEARRPC